MVGPIRIAKHAYEGSISLSGTVQRLSGQQFQVTSSSDVHRINCGWSSPSCIRRSPGQRAVAGDLSPARDRRSEEVLMLPWTPLPSEQASKDTDRYSDNGSWHPSMGWKWMPYHLSKDHLWQKIRQEAQADADVEPTLASTLHSTVLVHHSFEKTMAFILANKLASSTLLGTHLVRLCQEAYSEEPDIIEASSADLQAVFERDPACDKYTQCMLYFKGFQGVQSHRIAHWLWMKGRKPLALAIQSRISEVFHVDIHPAAQIGRGILIDHATGLVIGETSVIGDNVSMMHHVTLGGSGVGKGARHPHIGHGVLIGAGATILGPIHVGCGTKIGAGTVVVSNLPSHSVAVGVPARIIKTDCDVEPVQDMDQCSDIMLDYVI